MNPDIRAIIDSIETHIRIGRHGNCGDCPRAGGEIGTYPVFPEKCPNTNRFDHHGELPGLIDQLRRYHDEFKGLAGSDVPLHRTLGRWAANEISTGDLLKCMGATMADLCDVVLSELAVRAVNGNPAACEVVLGLAAEQRIECGGAS